MTNEKIAEICHEVNRGLCVALGDQKPARWDFAPKWQKESMLAGVRSVQAGQDNSSKAHEAWVLDKTSNGWVYGETKDEAAKTHPNLVPFDGLPPEQQLKDRLFVTVVKALSGS